MVTSIEFHDPIAYASDYPLPHICATPQQFTWKRWGKNYKQQSQFKENSYFTKNGRSALAYIISALALKDGDTVLLPEYHCPAMIEPFIWANINIVFYRLNSDLSVNLKSLEQQINGNVSAVLLVRFFGFACRNNEALKLVKEKHLKVIEDCAHAFFSSPLKNEVYQSDASFCSLNKFFSCYDGGMLRTESKRLQTQLEALNGPGLFKEIKYLLGNFGSVEKLASMVKKVVSSEQSNSAEQTLTKLEESAFRYFSEADMKQRCYTSTMAQVTLENYNRVAYKRRKNYQRLYEGLRGSTIGSVFFHLDEETVPYVFPFLLNTKEDFDYIRKSGIQILRWEEFCTTLNENVECYRERLVQIPCHQDLSTEQLDFIIQQFNKN